MKHRTSSGGSKLPRAVGDYTKHDPYAARMSLELVNRIRDTYGTFSTFLRAHMHEDDAPSYISGDHRNKTIFDNAKRALSDRIGSPACIIADWGLIEFILTRCPRTDDHDITHHAGGDGDHLEGHRPGSSAIALSNGHLVRARLAGLWLASQRYEPCGYDGPVDVPADAPPPYSSPDEAPTDVIRAAMLTKMLATATTNLAQTKDELARRNDCEKMSIRIISTQRKQIEALRRTITQMTVESADADLVAANADLVAENAVLRRENDDLRGWHTPREQRIHDELTGKLREEQGARHLIANRVAMLTAMIDAMRTDSDTDPLQSLRNADFPLGTDIYPMLNHPTPVDGPRGNAATRHGDSPPPAHVLLRRFLAVYLRSFLLNVFGHVPGHDDDPAGLYRMIVRDGTLPPIDQLREALSAHSVTLQFAGPLLDALADAELRAIPVQGAPVREITTEHTPAQAGLPSSGPQRPSLPESGSTECGSPESGRHVSVSGDGTSTPPTASLQARSTQTGHASHSGSADVRRLDVLAGGHRAGVLETPVDAVTLINKLTLKRSGSTA